MKNAVKLFLREWKYLLKRPRSLVLMVLVPIFVTCICGSGYGKGYFSDYNDEDESAKAMRDGEIVGCLIFPADFTRKMQLGQQAEVLLGSSAVNMGYGSTINLKGSEVLGTVSTQIAVKSLVAKGETVDDALATMNPVSFYTRQWYNPTNNFSRRGRSAPLSSVGAMRFPCEEAFCSGLSTAVFSCCRLLPWGSSFPQSCQIPLWQPLSLWCSPRPLWC